MRRRKEGKGSIGHGWKGGGGGGEKDDTGGGEEDRGSILLGFLLAVAYPANCGAHSWKHRASHGQPSPPCNWSKRKQVVCGLK